MNKNEFMKESTGFLSYLYDAFSDLPELAAKDFRPESCVLVIVDMVNGFVKEGKLSSPRVFKSKTASQGLQANACAGKSTLSPLRTATMTTARSFPPIRATASAGRGRASS